MPTQTPSGPEMATRSTSPTSSWPQGLADIWSGSPFMDLVRSWRSGAGSSNPIKVEEFTDGDQLVVRAELPGVDPDKDVAVILEDGILTISAERHSETSEKTDSGYRSEFRYGSFTRQLRMPPGTQADQIVASYKDGVLDIRVPKPAATNRSQPIPISHG